MNSFSAESKRAFTGRAFIFTVLGACLCVLAGAFTDVLKILGSGLCTFSEHRTVFLRALDGDVMLFAVPILAVLPFSASFANDVKSGFTKSYLTRTNVNGYLSGKGIGVSLSGGLSIALGMLLAYVILFLLISPCEYVGDRPAYPVIPKILTRLLLFFLSGCFWAEIGLITSSLTLNVHLAYAFPFIAYYLLIILQERYLRNDFMLNPKDWLTLSGDWPLNGWSCAILVFLLALVGLMVFFLIGRYRLRDDAVAKRVNGLSGSKRKLEARIGRSRLRAKKRGAAALELSQVFAAVRYDFRMWRGNIRVLLTFLLAFIFCFLLSDKAASFAYSVNTTMQAFEPFIWTFGDANSVLMISLLLVLLFADMPYLDAGAPYYLVRMKRRTWVMGQVIYVLIATFIYVTFIFTVTTLICMGNSFIGNMWSETAAILGYSGAGKQIVLPALVKTLEMSRPYSCAGTIFLLMLGYTMVLSLLMLFAKLRHGKAAGIVAAFGFSLFGLLLNPELIKTVFSISDSEMYKANVAVGWLSPLNHATYHMHSFGYDLLPKLWQTYLVFGLLSALLMILILRAIRRYSFDFLGTENG